MGKQACIKLGGMFLSSLSLQGCEMKFHNAKFIEERHVSWSSLNSFRSNVGGLMEFSCALCHPNLSHSFIFYCHLNWHTYKVNYIPFGKIMTFISLIDHSMLHVHCFEHFEIFIPIILTVKRFRCKESHDGLLGPCDVRSQ